MQYIVQTTTIMVPTYTGMLQKIEEKPNRVVKKYAKNKDMGVRIFNINYNFNSWIFEGKDYNSNLIIKWYPC